VCASGCEFPSIGAAIAGSSGGDEIEVMPGTYTEQVVVNKPLSISGAAGEPRPVIQSDGTDPTVTIAAEGAGTRLSHLDIRGVGQNTLALSAGTLTDATVNAGTALVLHGGAIARRSTLNGTAVGVEAASGVTPEAPLLSDSVVTSTADNGIAVRTRAVNTFPATVRLRNVTAIAGAAVGHRATGAAGRWHSAVRPARWPREAQDLQAHRDQQGVRGRAHGDPAARTHSRCRARARHALLLPARSARRSDGRDHDRPQLSADPRTPAPNAPLHTHGHDPDPHRACGTHRLPFSGRIHGTPLTAGNYRAIFTATNSAGSSTPRALGFTVIRR
jgi:hypothetical protein